ncbi:MAG: carbohydrate kinase family protein [Chromatiales bacterium 21-64-14]|nr:MAG: carbohydrate kinase family protein [Chromatiales bacterium 21-64-14]HQU15343.1 carbohydrate kinase family protein [Gammaproteobacteria bacterium]
MSALICGSFAFDTIMVFHDRFKNHILPEQVHILNVSFLVPELRREFGGCAGNIAYNLRLLGGSSRPMGTVGNDFGPYAAWLDENDIDRHYVTTVEGAYTAQAYITTDLDDNQITAFHPGAMNSAHQNRVPSGDGITVGIVSPDGRQGMIEHAAQFAQAGIPFIFDPGQGMPMFDGPALSAFVDQATWVTLNDYEFQLMQERTGLGAQELAGRVTALIITRGGAGSTIYSGGRQIDIPAAPVTRVADPTGCGDAYRAGLLYGLMNDLDWETTGRIASLMGAVKIEHHGTQNHRFDRAGFGDRFKEAFGYAL